MCLSKQISKQILQVTTGIAETDSAILFSKSGVTDIVDNFFGVFDLAHFYSITEQ